MKEDLGGGMVVGLMNLDNWKGEGINLCRDYNMLNI